MVLLRSSREKLITQARVKAKAEGEAIGRAEGANKMYVKWSAWNARRIEHERRGEPFDEPPPAPDDGSDDNRSAIEDNHQ